MFGFLKDKLKQAIDSFKKKAEDHVEEVEDALEEKPVEIKKPQNAERKKEEKKTSEKKHKKEKHVEKESDIRSDEEPDIKPNIDFDEEPEAKPVEKKATVVNFDIEPKAKPIEIPDKEPDIEPVDIKEEQEEQLQKYEEKLDAVEEETKEEPAKTEEEKPKKSGGFFGLFKKKEKVEEVKKEPEDAKKETAEKNHEIQKEPIKQVIKEQDALKSQDAEFDEQIKEKETIQEESDEEQEGKKGFFAKLSESVTKVSLSEKKFDELFWEVEIGLLENNIAIEVIDKIKQDLKKELVEGKFPKKELESRIMKALRKSISSLFDVPTINLIEKVKTKKPYVIVFIGINGTGKTTTLAKITNLFLKNKLKPVMGACDTFRAAAIQQLEEHATVLGVKIIKHNYGSDPAAVAFDTIEHAKAHGKDVVLIDTAGRLHSNKNLMQELEKVIKIAKPDLKIFIGESLAGNDVVEQVKLFNESVGIDGIILSKADTDEKGGAAISVSYITGKPILYLGTGQKYDDLEKFDKEKLLKQIGL